MAALTSDRNTPIRSGQTLIMPVAGGKKIYAGALVARNSNGYAVPGETAVGLIGLGRAESSVDNTTGTDGSLTIEIRKGVFRFSNSSGSDEITKQDIGLDCYIVDDQTVAKTDGTGSRSRAGKVFDVEPNGVWVKFD